MILIKSNEQLKKYIPNTLKEVQGEASLYDKMYSYIASAEKWLQTYLLSYDTMAEVCDLDDSHELKALCCNIVAVDAFHHAVPSLDLVLTPNGFGIVSNQNLTPASKERVVRLQKSLLRNRDEMLDQLLHILPSFSDWKTRSTAQFFKFTLFQNLELCTLMEVPEELWKNYIMLRAKVVEIEREMITHFVSMEQMDVFHSEVMDGNASSKHAIVIEWLKDAIISRLKNIPPSRTLVEDVVNIMRDNPEDFPQWHASSMPKAFSPIVFQNKKSNKAYWF